MRSPSAAPPPSARVRGVLPPLMLLVVALGLGSRSALAASLPRVIGAYAGDTLWASLVYLGLVFLCPRLSFRAAAAAALGLSFLVEFSQLWHPPWLDALRATRLGALVLGRGFLASDLLCYTAGVALAALLDTRLPRHPAPP